MQYVDREHLPRSCPTACARASRFNNSWSQTEGLLPSFNGTDRPDTNYDKISTFPNYSVSGNMDWVASQKLFFGVRGGYYMSDQHDTNVTVQPLYRFRDHQNVGFLDVPARLQKPAGFTSIPINTQVVRDQQTRAFFQADGTWYAKAGGDHQFKFGVQADRVGNDVLSGESRPRVTVNWDTAPERRQRGTYGYYTVRSNGAAPTKGFITEGNIHTTNIGLFVQDAWTISNKLTINAGLRTERERVPTYTTGADIPEFGIEFSFKDKLAPRAGFAYDIKGDGKWKAFGSWGVFYDIFKLELPRGSFGGDKWLEYYYTLDTSDWPNLLANSACPPACPGTLISGRSTSVTRRSAPTRFEPDLKPMRQQEATVGLDHQLTQPGRPRRPLRPQADRPRDRGHGLARRRPATRSTSSPTRAKGSPSSRSPTRTSRCRSRSATTTASSSRVEKRVRRHLVLSAPATCGAACTATTPACHSRTRTAAPARTSGVCSTIR